ncbi:MAG: prepilin-type N-terminal cleavage/methylation domain-containing protein [Sphingobacteriales bacterium]|nr:prepilin-type N-terminal cleavage/methylation domain-containing protein [Sphingobacteriales bacterium]
MRKIKAFTLTEILIVLVIIGILVLLALPNLMPLITKAKYTEAKLQLEHLYTLEKTYFFEHSKYSTDLSALGFVQEELNNESNTGKANYQIEISEASSNAFIARATSIVDFDGDGVYNVWEIDQDKNLKEVIQD